MKRKSCQMKNADRIVNRKKKQRRATTNIELPIIHDDQVSTSETVVCKTEEPITLNSSLSSLPLLDLPSFMLNKMKKRCSALSLASSRDPTILLSNYSTMSNETFKNVLSNFISATVLMDKYDQWLSLVDLLNYDEIVSYLRQLTHMKNMASYFQLQVTQWSHFHHVGTTEKIWIGRLSSKMALKNSTCQSYGRKKHVIEQRIQIYMKKLERINRDMKNHLEQCPTLLLTYQGRMVGIINDLIERDQYELRIEMGRRQTLPKMDAKDHQLLQEFYELKPKKLQIKATRAVWKAFYNEKMLRYEINMFKTWLSLRSTSFLVCSLRDLHLTTINQLLVQSLFDYPLDMTMFMNTSDEPSSNKDTYEQMIRHLSDKVIADAEALVENYHRKGVNEEMKLSNRKPKSQDVTTHEKLIATCEVRKQHMIERMRYDMEQKQRFLQG